MNFQKELVRNYSRNVGECGENNINLEIELYKIKQDQA